MTKAKSENNPFVYYAIAATAALVLAFAPLAAQQQASPVPQIVTNGTGEATITPDRARVDIAVETRGATAAAAAQENARISQLVQTRLRSLGLANERIATWGYQVHAEYDHSRNDGRPRIIGYIARNTVRADVWNINQVGAIIDGAVAAGANNVNGIDFYSSNLETARQTALAQAVSRAHADAQVMAAAAGGRLGDLLEISSGFSVPQPMPYMARMELAQAADATPVNPGERTISATVSARWRFLPR